MSVSIEIRNVDTIDDVAEFKRWLSLDRKVLALDIETSGLSWITERIRLVQFGDARGGWVLTYDEWRGVVRDALTSYRGQITGHNIRFDLHFLAHDLGIRTEDLPWWRIHDTLNMAHLIDPTRPKGLKPLAARHIDPAAVAGQKELDDDMRRGKWGWDTVPIGLPSYRFYAGLDTVLSAILWEKFYPYVMAKYPQAYELEQIVSQPLFAMERHGIMLDAEYTQQAQIDLMERASEIARSVEVTYGLANIGSNPQLRDKLLEQGWIPNVDQLTPAGTLAMESYLTGHEEPDPAAIEAIARQYPSMRAEVLEDLALQLPLAHEVVQYRLATKAASTWLQNFLTAQDPATGRVHPSIRQVAARTGRMSITDPPLQTLPRESDAKAKGLPSIRDCFVAPEGRKLISADFSSIEARLFAHFAGEPDMLRTIHEGGDLHALVAAAAYQIPIGEVTKDQRQIAKSVNFACVPTDTQVLTVEHGWVPITDVRVGETVYGYEDGATRRTKVEATHLYDSAPVIEFGNAHRKFRCTPNHRWLIERWARTGDGSRRLDGIDTDDVSTLRSEHRILLAAPCDEPDTSGLTPDEAALIAWMITDGHVRTSPLTGITAQGTNGERQGCHAAIYQKPGAISYNELRSLLRRLGVDDTPGIYAGASAHRFKVPTDMARRLIRSYTYDVTQYRSDALSDLVQRFGAEQRRAFIDAFHLAEGWVSGTAVQLGQNVGPTLDAILLALSLEGFYPSVSITPQDRVPMASADHATVNVGLPHMTNQRITITDIGHEPVACLTTGLGTFMARQGDRIFLTGNSLYGAGPARVATTAGITVAEAQDFFRRRDVAFPGIRGFQKGIQEEAKEQRMHGDRGHVTTHLGSRISITDDEPEYRLTNYLIQGSAAVVLKDRIVSLHNAGLTDMMLLPIHDEVLFEVPTDDCAAVAEVIREAMPDRHTFDVPLDIEVSDPADRWGAAK